MKNDTARRPRRTKILYAVFALGVIGLIGHAWQRWAESADAQRYPAPGELVDAGDVQLHLHCTGTGSPTVIAEAGAGHHSLGWRHIQAAVSDHTRFCSYDRAGLGWSDAATETPDKHNVTRQLHAALQNAGIDGPYVLLAHSIGGIYARHFAQMFPSETAGLVLVDTSIEGQFLRMPEQMRTGAQRAVGFQTRMLRVCESASTIGAVRALGLWNLLSRSYAEEVRPQYVAFRNRTAYCGSLRNELLGIDAMTAQHAPLQSLGDVPLVVLAQGDGDRTSPQSAMWQDTWREMQAELADLSTKGRMRVVEDAGHSIHIERPDVVIDAVMETIHASREISSPDS